MANPDFAAASSGSARSAPAVAKYWARRAMRQAIGTNLRETPGVLGTPRTALTADSARARLLAAAARQGLPNAIAVETGATLARDWDTLVSGVVPGALVVRRQVVVATIGDLVAGLEPRLDPPPDVAARSPSAILGKSDLRMTVDRHLSDRHLSVGEDVVARHHYEIGLNAVVADYHDQLGGRPARHTRLRVAVAPGTAALARALLGDLDEYPRAGPAGMNDYVIRRQQRFVDNDRIEGRDELFAEGMFALLNTTPVAVSGVSYATAFNALMALRSDPGRFMDALRELGLWQPLLEARAPSNPRSDAWY
ncbi:MAG: hypothetical protein IPG96_01825 [Proteobacteria bacterium]|nr:hypothetical protein [Pseudomonadota bacterium]